MTCERDLLKLGGHAARHLKSTEMGTGRLVDWSTNLAHQLLVQFVVDACPMDPMVLEYLPT